MNEYSSEDQKQFYKLNVSTVFSLTFELFGAELNLRAGRSVLSDSVARLQDMQPDAAGADWLASPWRLVQSAAGKTLAYQQHVHDIAVATQSASAKIVEAQYDQFSRDVLARIDSWARACAGGFRDGCHRCEIGVFDGQRHGGNGAQVSP